MPQSLSEVMRTTVSFDLTNREGWQVNARGITGTELERVLNSARSSRLSAPSPTRRSIIEVFTETIAALTRARIRYVLAGTLAYGLYAPPRATENITVLVHPDERTRVKEALRATGFGQPYEWPCQLSFEDRMTGINVTVSLSTHDPGRAALDHPEPHAAFDLIIPVIKPEYLVWLLCRSDLIQPFADTVELVKAGQLDVEKLRRMLRRAGDQATLAQLDRVLKTAAAERHSSYNCSVAARRRPRQ